MITGRFVTRQVDEIARVEILGPDGQIEALEGTTIHPIWSEDRQDWVPLGELQQGEALLAATAIPGERSFAGRRALKVVILVGSWCLAGHWMPSRCL